MYKNSKNPIVEALTKSHKERSCALSSLKQVKLDGIRKNCVWCLAVLRKGRHKWCSLACIASALAWAAPSRAHGVRVLLYRDNFKCTLCHFDYRPYFNQAFSKIKRNMRFRRPRMKSFRIEYLIRVFKRLMSRDTRLEVDHIAQVSLGGQTLGFENVRLLCSKCHKIKTKQDTKDRIAIKGNVRKGVKFTDAHKKSMSLSRKGFDSLNRRIHREKMYENKRISILAINLVTKEELKFTSLKDAANILGLQAYNISRVLNNKQNRKQHKNWTFKLI